MKIGKYQEIHCGIKEEDLGVTLWVQGHLSFYP